MNVLALIPARGGSKGIPKKNLRLIGGRELIAWSISQAIESKLIDRVICSTDSEEIREVALRHGAEAPFLRPSSISADLSTDLEAFTHSLEWLIQNESYQPDLLVHLRPTGPLRDVRLIDKAIQFMIDNPSYTSLRSISLAEQNPFKMWKFTSHAEITPLLPDPRNPDSPSCPRQMHETAFWQNGYVDIVRPSSILDQKNMTGDKVAPLVIYDPIFELDYPEDLVTLEEHISSEAYIKQLRDLPRHSLGDFHHYTQRHPS